jgi:glycosyltransferase involved in cell wall biosynthesis
VFGKDFNMHTSGRVQCEFMGWRDQTEVVQLLNESHLNYIPYWFDPVFKEEAANSFPSKMSTYCAAAQPVLVHAPDYATPIAFLQEHDIGYSVTTPSARDLADTIRDAVLDPEARSRKGQNAATCFSNFLSTSCMRRSFEEFLGLDTRQSSGRN